MGEMIMWFSVISCWDNFMVIDRHNQLIWWMEIQAVGSQNIVQQQSQLQPSPSPLLARQSSWYNLTLDEVQNQLGDLGKPVRSMNLDELLKYISLKEESQTRGLGNASSSSSLQHQASLTLARTLSGKTVDQVWNEIQQGQRKRYGHEMGGQDKIPTMGETTLEDFLVQAGLFADTTIEPPMVMDVITGDPATPQSYPQQIGSSSSHSVGIFPDATISGRKRDTPDDLESTLDKRLRRKIKNRESAARSRARKQAYHNELVNKVSRLEMENTKLKKEKELEEVLPWELSPEPRYQLRRTSSASF